MKFNRRTKLITHFMSMVPFIDVLFVLLLFSLFSSTFLFQSAVRIELPAQVAPEKIRTDAHTVIITREGSLFWNGRKVNREGLMFGFRLAVREGKPSFLIIKADREIPQGIVVEIMEMAKEAGINEINLATLPPE